MKKITDPALKLLIQKKIFILIPITSIISHFTNKYTPDKFVIGYQFVFSFLSLLPGVFIILYVLYLVLYNISLNPSRLNSSLKYVGYALVLIFSVGPLLYLWSMRDVISHLKW